MTSPSRARSPQGDGAGSSYRAAVAGPVRRCTGCGRVVLTAEPDPGSCTGCRRAAGQLRDAEATVYPAPPRSRAEVVGAAVLLVIGLLAGLVCLFCLGELVSSGRFILAYWVLVTGGMAAGTIRTGLFILWLGRPPGPGGRLAQGGTGRRGLVAAGRPGRPGARQRGGGATIAGR